MIKRHVEHEDLRRLSEELAAEARKLRLHLDESASEQPDSFDRLLRKLGRERRP